MKMSKKELKELENYSKQILAIMKKTPGFVDQDTTLNIGNPGAFGFRMPESMRRAIVENLHQADPYSHQKGIFPAREAVVMQQQNRGVMDVTADDVFIGTVMPLGTVAPGARSMAEARHARTPSKTMVSWGSHSKVPPSSTVSSVCCVQATPWLSAL